MPELLPECVCELMSISCRQMQANKAGHCLQIAQKRKRQTSQQLLVMKRACQQQQKQLADQSKVLEQGSAKFKKLQHERDGLVVSLAAVEASRSDVDAKLSRAEGLVQRLEERCSTLTFDKKKMQDKLSSLTEELSKVQDKLKVRCCWRFVCTCWCLLRAFMHHNYSNLCQRQYLLAVKDTRKLCLLAVERASTA